MLLQMMAQYCDCVDQLPLAGADVLVRLVELLKNFNSRTCQLILGAGALQLVGLKTITVRNLGEHRVGLFVYNRFAALATRCLQLVLHHIPYVERQFLRHMDDPTAATYVRHLNQVAVDYRDHIAEIDSKLVSVVDYQLTTCIAKVRSMQCARTVRAYSGSSPAKCRRHHSN